MSGWWGRDEREHFPSAHWEAFDEVERPMGKQTRLAGDNGVEDFPYSQNTSGSWRSPFDRGDVHWHGSGQIALTR